MQCERCAQHISTASRYNKRRPFGFSHLVPFPICDCKHITLHSFPLPQGRHCTKSKAAGSDVSLFVRYFCADYIPAKPADLVSHYATVVQHNLPSPFANTYSNQA